MLVTKPDCSSSERFLTLADALQSVRESLVVAPHRERTGISGKIRAIARENLRTEISDYSGWFGANVMDSQSRGRDIYLAMSPSGIAITPEFCSKNPYAIALRGR